MKKHNFQMKANIFTALCVLACFCLLVACGSVNPTPEQVAQKIADKQPLTDADYSTMIKYCGDYAEKAQTYYDIINGQNVTPTETQQATSDLASLYAENKYLDAFSAALYAVDESQLGKENVEKVKKYSSLQAFPLPGGAGKALENPAVVGMIEDMPDTDTSPVIATGDGEAVDIQVK